MKHEVGDRVWTLDSNHYIYEATVLLVMMNSYCVSNPGDGRTGRWKSDNEVFKIGDTDSVRQYYYGIGSDVYNGQKNFVNRYCLGQMANTS